MEASNVVEESNKLFEELTITHQKFYELWKSNVFLTWRWWIGVSLIVIPWTVWLIFRNRKSTHRLLFAGLLVMVISSFMDIIGIAFGAWTYPYNVFPLMPEFIPFDISMLPVATMLLLQFFPKIRPVYKAIGYAAFGSFVFQPLMKWISLYDNLHWHHYYSFPILFLIYLAADYTYKRNKFDRVTENST